MGKERGAEGMEVEREEGISVFLYVEILGTPVNVG